MHRTISAVVALFALAPAAACAPSQDPQPAAGTATSGAVPGTTAQAAIDAAVEALGGIERIAAVRNITMQEDVANRGGDARDRRMLMHTNPVVAVRAALDPANTLGGGSGRLNEIRAA